MKTHIRRKETPSPNADDLTESETTNRRGIWMIANPVFYLNNQKGALIALTNPL